MTHARFFFRRTLGVATLLAVAELVSAQPAQRPTLVPDVRGAWRMRDGGLVALYQTAAHDSGWRFVDFRTGASHQLYVRDSVSLTSSDAWSGASPARIRYTVSLDARGRAAGLTVTRAGATARRGSV